MELAWTQGDGKVRKAAAAKLFEPLVEALDELAAGLDAGLDGAVVGAKDSICPSVETALVEGNPVGVVFLDLDHFKEVNDTMGHQQGDACLETVRATLSQVARGRGRVFSAGGDEFVVVVRNSTQAEAILLAERLRHGIEQAVAEYGVTASVGVAASDIHAGINAKALTDRADKAMYAAKENGRNRVTGA